MVDPITAGFSLLKVKSFFKKLFTSPWFYVVLAFIAIGVGTFVYLDKSTDKAVASAVTQADSKATIQTYKTKEIVTQRTQVIDDKFDALAAQTTKDYANARAQVETAPAAERDAQAPALLIDVLNDLDRLRSGRDPSAVPDADVPVG